MTILSRLTPLTLLCSALIMAPAHAESIKMKLAPGLWEQTSTTLINGQNMDDMMHQRMEQAMGKMTPEQRAQMEKHKSQMPPEARAKMEAAMNAANKPRVACLTPEIIAKGIDLDNVRNRADNHNKDCTMKVLSSSDSGGKFELTCNSPQRGSRKSTGEYKRKSDKEWSLSMVSEGDMPARMHAGASAPGGKMVVNIDVVARWKGSDCGSVKPAPQSGE